MVFVITECFVWWSSHCRRLSGLPLKGLSKRLRVNFGDQTSSNIHSWTNIPICLSRVWLQTEMGDTKAYYHLIIKITISEKRRILKLWKKGKICIEIPTKDM